jgi:hypothetical protein
MRKLAAAVILAASLQPLIAEDPPPLPDPAGIVVPDLSGSSKPEVIRDGVKYFFFRQEGVSFQQAHADLADCFMFLQPSSWQSVHLDRFVPWVSKPGRKTVATNNPYGLVGAVILGAVEGSLHHRDYQAKLRSCMEPRGYTRYGVAEDIWKRVRDLPREQAIAVQAKIASGPPFGTKVVEK